MKRLAAAAASAQAPRATPAGCGRHLEGPDSRERWSRRRRRPQRRPEQVGEQTLSAAASRRCKRRARRAFPAIAAHCRFRGHPRGNQPLLALVGRERCAPREAPLVAGKPPNRGYPLANTPRRLSRSKTTSCLARSSVKLYLRRHRAFADATAESGNTRSGIKLARRCRHSRQ